MHLSLATSGITLNRAYCLLVVIELLGQVILCDRGVVLVLDVLGLSSGQEAFSAMTSGAWDEVARLVRSVCHVEIVLAFTGHLLGPLHGGLW